MHKIFLFFLSLPILLFAQNHSAAVKEYRSAFLTYPFSDANPIPITGRIYPYFRFDGFTDQPIKKEWQVVELENDYLRVKIMPEIGGKIWSAIEKSSGRPFIYDNQVVKFRDIAMRGPWTSGGIEANYGIIGHTPNCATAVDYCLQKKQDGSVSCYIATLDLLTRTYWCIDINLPADKAYFTTTSFWQNTTPLEQPYYTWMNTGIKARGNLQLIYPGTHYIDHDGNFHAWPIHEENHQDLSFYENNNFGSYKSYHVLGQLADFFGAYWHDDQLGMVRYAPREQKLGKKIWIWGLSQQGMIWEKLLTDHDGQYVEVQSGRLFNQSAEASTFTPFKHHGFAPYATDTWTEYWFPIKETRGLLQATPLGGLNLVRAQGKYDLYFSPVQYVQDTLFVYDGEEEKYVKPVHLQPLHTIHETIPCASNLEKLQIRLGRHQIIFQGSAEQNQLQRPLSSPTDFNWNGYYGLYLQGKELIRQRAYARAAVKLDSCLLQQPYYLPALVDRAILHYRSLQYAAALAMMRTALSIDTYDGAANFYYGLIHRQLGNLCDSRDGFQTACLNTEYRAAALTELAKLDVLQGHYGEALEHAEQAWQRQQDNLEALSIKATVLRRQGKIDQAVHMHRDILQRNPLHHLTRFEQLLCKKIDQAEFSRYIRNELPQETYIESAVWYERMGLNPEAEALLLLAPRQPEVLYWSAFIKMKQQKAHLADLQAADEMSTTLQFPFRPETAEVLTWALQQQPQWQQRYYLALIYAAVDEPAKAVALLTQCKTTPDEAAFYAFRAELNRDHQSYLADMAAAATLDPGQWRIGYSLCKYYAGQGQFSEALRIAQQYYSRFPENQFLAMSVAAQLGNCRRYQECLDLLQRLNILPCEGATDGRRLYRQAHLLLAGELFQQKNYVKALQHIDAARLWPEHLGVGKPYDEDIDVRLEDWMAGQCSARLAKKKIAKRYFQKVIDGQADTFPGNDLVKAWALREVAGPGQAVEYLHARMMKEPDNPWLQWSMQNYHGSEQKWPEWITADENGKILAAWLQKK